VIILDRGRVLLAEDAETLRSRGVSVTGPTDAVDAFIDGRRLSTSQVTVYGELEPAGAAAAHAAGLELGGVDLQDLFVDLTSKEAAR